MHMTLSNADTLPALANEHRGDTDWEETFWPHNTTGRIEAETIAELQTCVTLYEKRKANSEVKGKTKQGKAKIHEVLISIINN